MVSAIWGVFIWKEFSSAPPASRKLIPAMFVFFLLGLGSIGDRTYGGQIVNVGSLCRSPSSSLAASISIWQWERTVFPRWGDNHWSQL